MRQAAAATAQFGARSTAVVEAHGGSLDKMAKGAAIAGGALVLGVGLAVKAYADFDQAMSGVRANVTASPAEFAKLTESVRTAGTAWGFTANQTAAGAEDLAKAGLSAADIMGGALTGALSLAAAGQISTGEAAETAATAMTIFSLKGKDVPHIADLIAAGADKSTASVHSLAEGLQNGGSSAAQMGLTLQDTVGVLSEFDQAGLKGADGGTALKSMFQALANQTPRAKKALDEYGISVYDASGKFVGMSDLAGQLQTKLGGLSDAQRNQALAVIFGSHAVRAANILMKDGAKGVTDWANSVNQSGFAAHNAGVRMDNLKGDLSKLKASFVNNLIGAGSGANGPFRGIVQGATAALNVLGQMPPSVTGVGLAIAGIGGAGLLAAAGLLKIIGTVRKVRTEFLAGRAAMTAWSLAAGGSGSAISVLGARVRGLGSSFSRMSTGAKVGVGLAVAAIVALGVALTNTGVETENFGRSSAQLESDMLKSQGGAVDTSKAFANLQIALGGDQSLTFANGLKLATSTFGGFDASVSGAVHGLTRFGTGAGSATEAVRARLKAMSQALADMVTSGHKAEAAQIFAGYVKQANAAGVSTKDLNKLMPEYQSALLGVKNDSALATAGTTKLTAAQQAAADAAKAQAAKITSVVDAMKSLGEAQLGQSNSAIAYQQAIADGNKALKDNGRNLDITTEKGRNNQTALNGIAESTKKWAQDTFTATSSALIHR